MCAQKVKALGALGFFVSTLIPTSNTQTMTSEELFKLVNTAREQFGETTIKYADFVSRMVDELDGDEIFNYENFSVEKLHNNTERKVWTLTVEQCMLVSMRESKAVRRSVLHKLKELEANQTVTVQPSNDLQFDRASKLAKLCMDTLNLPQSGQLKLIRFARETPSFREGRMSRLRSLVNPLHLLQTLQSISK